MTAEARALGWSELTTSAIVPAVEGVAAEITNEVARSLAEFTLVRS